MNIIRAVNNNFKFKLFHINLKLSLFNQLKTVYKLLFTKGLQIDLLSTVWLVFFVVMEPREEFFVLLNAIFFRLLAFLLMLTPIEGPSIQSSSESVSQLASVLTFSYSTWAPSSYSRIRRFVRRGDDWSESVANLVNDYLKKQS